VALAPDGALYIADRNHSIRRVASDGTITTVAGTGDDGFSGDGGPATEAELWGTLDVAVGPDGDLYIADTFHHRIRRVASDGTISTVAGTGDTGFSGDGGPGNKARLSYPQGVTVGPEGHIYIADTSNHRVRRLDSGGASPSADGYRIPSASGER